MQSADLSVFTHKYQRQKQQQKKKILKTFDREERKLNSVKSRDENANDVFNSTVVD